MTHANKAILTFALTFLTALLASLEGRKEFSELTALEWLIVVASALVSAGAVYLVPNRPARRIE